MESLLRHHTTKALIETQPLPETPAKTTPPERDNQGKKHHAIRKPLMRQATIGLKRRRPALIAAGLIALTIVGTAYWVFNRVESALRDSVARQLETDVAADVRALTMWIADRKEDVEAWASNDEIRGLLADLIANTISKQRGQRASYETADVGPRSCGVQRLRLARPKWDGHGFRQTRMDRQANQRSWTTVSSRE